MQSIHKLEYLKKFVFNFAKSLKSCDVVCLDGDLGSGKTQFTKFLAEYFHVKEEVTSPTFPLIIEHKGDFNIFHFDFYRLKSTRDLYEIGYYDYLQLDGISVIEWSSRFPEEIPTTAHRFLLTKDGKNRTITKLS